MQGQRPEPSSLVICLQCHKQGETRNRMRLERRKGPEKTGSWERGKKSGLYSKCKGKSQEDFTRGGDGIQFDLFKNSF